MDILKRLADLIPILEPYPSWVKILISAWTLLTAALLLSLVFAEQQKPRSSNIFVSGRVLSVAGIGVPSASIELTLSSAPIHTVTDSEGQFRLEAVGVKSESPGRIRIAASNFRSYERVIQLKPDAPDLGTFVLPADSIPGTDSAVDPAIQVERREKAILDAPEDVLDRYATELRGDNTGVVKLLSSRAVEANRQFLRINGEGTYYSFLRRTHEYGYGSDIKLENGQLRVGFAGLDFGHFLNVGDASVTQLHNLTADPPAWLSPSKREAWKYMWNYTPPSVTADVRRAQRESRNKLVGGSSVSSEVPAVPGTAFLLRSISYNRSDLLVSLRVERLTEDGSAVVVWKILKVLDTPVASGPEPERY